jgi:hypothetical protein
MDTEYTFTLHQYYKEIKEHEASLIDIQNIFITSPTLPLHHLQPTLQPTIHILSRMRELLLHVIHIHE